jgi:crotonobetaine/carnitine-CoA ligase
MSNDLQAYDLPLEERDIGRFLRMQAASIPDSPYLTVGGRTFTFGEADARSRAIAIGLSRRGVREGDRVMLMLPNCAEFVFAWYACSLLGAAVVPINFNLQGFLLDGLFADAAVHGLIVHRAQLPALRTLEADLLARIPWVAVVDPDADPLPEAPHPGTFDFRELALDSAGDPAIEPDYRRVQVISYTSGTTGPAKGVMIPNAQCFSSACTFMKMTAMTREDTLYAPLPLFHGLSSRMGVVPALVLGAHVHLDEKFSASGYWERAAACGATLGLVVHAVAPLMKAQPPGPWDRAHRVRAIFNCAHDLQFEERFGVRMVRGFSMTETSFLICTPYPERRVGSIGRAHDDWELRLVDEHDRPVPKGSTGELIARPRRPHIWMQGYLNKPQATVDAWRNLWFHTGDMLRQDEEGYFHFVDRKKDRIRRRGENVSSADIEFAVGSHPGVAECVALAHPASNNEDDIRVVAVPKPNAEVTPAGLHEFLQSRLPKFMWPRYIEFVDRLPRTGTDKVEKQRLAKAGLGATVWDAQA